MDGQEQDSNPFSSDQDGDLIFYTMTELPAISLEKPCSASRESKNWACKLITVVFENKREITRYVSLPLVTFAPVARTFYVISYVF